MSTLRLLHEAAYPPFVDPTAGDFRLMELAWAVTVWHCIDTMNQVGAFVPR